jgi:hypothetical protein
MPNYGLLNSTPASEAKAYLSGIAQYGAGRKDELVVKKQVIPFAKSDKRKLAPQHAENEIADERHPDVQTPLAIAQPAVRRKRKPVTASVQPSKEFKNRFDHPLTQREINQLKLQKLKGPDSTTEKVLAKLLSASGRVGRRLARQIEPLEPERVIERIEPEPNPTLDVTASAAAEETPTTLRPIKTEVEIESKEEEPEMPTPKPAERTIAGRSKRQVLQQAEHDLAQLTHQYPIMHPDEQRMILDRLRDTYHASRRANVPQIKKLISDIVQEMKPEKNRK